ncbi:MAG: NrfD/PsrC family molybdoenzyme membrane anchor subunit [Xanthomonadales bacterium]
MKRIIYSEIEGRSTAFRILVLVLGALVLAAMYGVFFGEDGGHSGSGANNQVVWGVADVFAMFLIVSASGALNVAIISSVFRKTLYKPLERLSCLLAIALLLGGMMILMLELGRPDRVIVAMLNRNLTSQLAWNFILYSGFITIVVIYLWFQMERRMNRFIPAVGMVAFIWRVILTTGSGSIYGFLVAREAYDSAVMGPMFVAMSFSFGLAVYNLVLLAALRGSGREIGDVLLRRLGRLLGIFVAVVLYFAAVQHLTNLYAAEHSGVERFILRDGGIYTLLFWGGQIFVGGLLPMVLLFGFSRRGMHPTGRIVALASTLVIVGAFAQLYVLVIGGQAYPLIMFPGMEVSSSFFDGVVLSYTPSLVEIGVGLGAISLSGLIVLFGIKLLRFLPATLANSAVDPYFVATSEKP